MTRADKDTGGQLNLMVSSTVFGIEPILDQVYGLLSGFGYNVWMSHKGTMPVDPGMTTLESCLVAVTECDVFLSIITPRYGSGVVGDDFGITHQELLKAVKIRKPRWILAHDRVIFARSVFRKLGCRTAGDRDAMLVKLGFDTNAERKKLLQRENKVIDDFRVIDIYDAATRQNISKVENRIGNWVQSFVYLEDVRRFVTAQFDDYESIKSKIEEMRKSSAKYKSAKTRSKK